MAKKEEKRKKIGQGVRRDITVFVDKADAAKAAEGQSYSIQKPVLARRIEICYAMLLDNVPFEVLRDQKEGGLRQLLEDRGQATSVPRREVLDCIPTVLAMEKEALIKELEKATAVSIIYDATPHVAECFAVVLRFLINDKVTHRVASIRMYEKGFTGPQLAGVVLEILLSELQIPRFKVRCETADGCPTNLAAMNQLRNIYPHLLDLICAAHSANVVGKVMMTGPDCPTPLAKRFESLWSQLMNQCPRARHLFKIAAGEATQRSSEIRWFCWFEIIAQAYKNSAAVRMLIFHDEDFASELRGSLREMLTPGVVEDLRMELAMATDVGDNLVKLSYRQEGDSELLCATTYDHWTGVLHTLDRMTSPHTPADARAVLLPNVSANAAALAASPQQAIALVQVAAERMRLVFDKMQEDTTNRLQRTLHILRACRVLNCDFVARTPLPALQQELLLLEVIPLCAPALMQSDLLAELPRYKQLADAQFLVPVEEGADQVRLLWQFWLKNALNLPTFWKIAQEVALVTPSSCTVERVFSLLTQGFSDNQKGALEDYLFASVTVRYNHIWKARANGE